MTPVTKWQSITNYMRHQRDVLHELYVYMAEQILYHVDKSEMAPLVGTNQWMTTNNSLWNIILRFGGIMNKNETLSQLILRLLFMICHWNLSSVTLKNRSCLMHITFTWNDSTVRNETSWLLRSNLASNIESCSKYNKTFNNISPSNIFSVYQLYDTMLWTSMMTRNPMNYPLHLVHFFCWQEAHRACQCKRQIGWRCTTCMQ